MKRVWGHVLTGATVLAGLGTAGAVVSACVHDDSTLFVSRVLAQQLVATGMQCVYTGDPTQPSVPAGILDARATAPSTTPNFWWAISSSRGATRITRQPRRRS